MSWRRSVKLKDFTVASPRRLTSRARDGSSSAWWTPTGWTSINWSHLAEVSFHHVAGNLAGLIKEYSYTRAVAGLRLLKILLVTRFKDLKAAILTLKMLTGSRLWLCKIILEVAVDKLILAHFPWSQWEVGTREHRPIIQKGILRRGSVSIFKISKYFQRSK